MKSVKVVNCCKCNKVIEISYDTWSHGKKRHPNNPQFYCKDCYKQLREEM